jgi:hypothetical protein
MSEYEHEVYEKYLNKISSEIKMLRSIIESLEAKSHDRQWVVKYLQYFFFYLNIFTDLSFSVIVQLVIGMKEN